MSETSSSNVTLNGTQNSQRSRQSVDTIAAQFVIHSDLAGSKERSDVRQETLNFMKTYFSQLADDRRRGKVFKHISMKKDGGDQLQSFTGAWLNLLRFWDSNLDALRLSPLRCIFTVLESSDVSVHNFVPIYNSLSLELPKISAEAVVSLVNSIGDRIKESKKDFKRRWKDCVLVLVNHTLTLEEVQIDGESQSGRVFVSSFISNWLQTAASRENFRYVVSIAKDIGLSNLVNSFITETILENLPDDSIRTENSVKAIGVLDHVDPKMCHRLLLALNTVWTTASPETRSPDLITLFPSLKRILADYPSVGKSLITLFKQQPGPVLCSEFGFLAIILICGIERYRVQAVQEVKKVLHKIWKFDDEIKENGWLREAEVGKTAETVRTQMEMLVKMLQEPDVKEVLEEETLWTLFGQPLLLVGQALLECSSSKEVTIVDGRVADGCPLWLFSHKILKDTLLSNTSVIPSQLIHLVHAIASAGNNGAALVLIDVLVDIVKKCTLEVLNNSKLLDGLFDYVCKMRRDVGVSLIRCLLPVINHRSALRQALFRNLKNDMLNDASVGAAIPILILLLRSVSQKKCLTAGGSHSFSQSFASFSTQSLEAMGMKPAVDDAVALEIIGILKRCLTQPASSKIVLYEGITEAASRCPTLVGPCLDLLVDHAETVPAWSPDDMVITNKNVTQLREPLPQLVQALECLCYESMTASAESATQIGDKLLQKAQRLVDKWVEKAVAEDPHDLGVDKLSEWNPNTPAGRANLVFAHMMISLYDVLIEHVWRQVDALQRERDTDLLIGILRRRGQLAEVLAEKSVRRKEAKVGSTEAASFDIAQGEVFTSAQSIAGILERLVPRDGSTNGIDSVKDELFSWTLDRALNLSKDLLRVNHPLHSLISSASHLITVASQLIDFYLGVECSEWLCSMPSLRTEKTKAAETYANICRYICTKYRSSPSKILPICTKHSINLTQSNSQGSGTNNALVRHVHTVMCKIYPALFQLERGSEEAKKAGVELEKQAKSLIIASNAVLGVVTSPKAANAIFKSLMKMLALNEFDSNAVLRDLLKFVSSTALRCCDNDSMVATGLNSMADEVIQVLSDESDAPKFKCITAASYVPIADFLMFTTEGVMQSIKTTVAFASEFCSKDSSLDSLLCRVISKADECSDTISRLLPLHTQFHLQKERLVVLLTAFFTAVEAPVDIMLSSHKLIPEVVEWNAVTQLSVLLKRKVQAIMAIADENVGLMDKESDRRGGGNNKRKLAKSKRDEGTYVKYVKSRESLQSKVLMLCAALKDKRLNLVIKNNSIGIRDFRLDMKVVSNRITRDDEPTPKRKRKRPAQEPEDNENVEEGAGDTSIVY